MKTIVREQPYILISDHQTSLCRRIGVLQHLQTLLSETATLADVMQLVQSFQHEFGMQASLEEVIQSLVGQSLQEQLSQWQQRAS